MPPPTAARRGLRGRSRSRNRVRETDAPPTDAGRDELGSTEVRIETVGENDGQEIQGGNGSGGGPSGGAAVPKDSSKGCSCPGCTWTNLDVQAFEILGNVGKNFAKNLDEDRVTAFEKMNVEIASNLGVLAFSRAMGLDAALKMIRDTHTMLGAPKKKTETAEEKPMEALRDWLNGGDVPELELVAAPADPIEEEESMDEEPPESIDPENEEEGDDATE